MNSRFLLPAAAIALFSAAGLVLVARTAAVPSASLPPSLLASSPASSIAPLDTLTMEESIRRLLELDRANDQVRNQRNVYFADANYPIVFGDLDGDHDPDAAALAVWEYGGSGWEQRLYVLRNNGGQENWEILAWTRTGWKLQPETVATQVAITNRSVTLQGSQTGTQHYSIHGRKLRQK